MTSNYVPKWFVTYVIDFMWNSKLIIITILKIEEITEIVGHQFTSLPTTVDQYLMNNTFIYCKRVRNMDAFKE